MFLFKNKLWEPKYVMVQDHELNEDIWSIRAVFLYNWLYLSRDESKLSAISTATTTASSTRMSTLADNIDMPIMIKQQQQQQQQQNVTQQIQQANNNHISIPVLTPPL